MVVWTEFGVVSGLDANPAHVGLTKTSGMNS